MAAGGLDVFQSPGFVSSVEGWVAGLQRGVEVYGGAGDYLLKIEECGEYYITHYGESIGKWNQPRELSRLDREILLGPVIVFALALKNVWSLHASAAGYGQNVIAFLGESGMGKSTLAAYLSQNAGWRLVADDILPVTGRPDGLAAYPHFPQLKLSPSAQPGVGLPERLPLDMIFELSPVASDALPEFKQLPLEQAVRVLLSHTAGTRLFDDTLLEAHLAFCAQAVESTPVYRLKYPHSRDALPKVKDMLESLC